MRHEIDRGDLDLGPKIKMFPNSTFGNLAKDNSKRFQVQQSGIWPNIITSINQLMLMSMYILRICKTTRRSPQTWES